MALTQDAFRWYEDGTESGSTEAAAENTAIEADVQVTSLDQHLRIRIQASAQAGAATDDYQLQYRKNAGTWTDVTTSSSDVQGFDSSNLTDGNATTQRLSAGSGTYRSGAISEDGLIDDLNPWSASGSSNYTELLYAVRFIRADVDDEDEIEFRVLYNGSTITYSATPSATINKIVYELTAESGSFTLTGTDASFTYPYANYSLTCSGGTFTLTGTPAALLWGRRLSAGSGTFTLTGSAVELARHGVVARLDRRRRKYGRPDYGQFKLGSRFKE